MGIRESLPQRDLDGLALPVDAQADQLVAIDAALRTLSLWDERQVSVEFRFSAVELFDLPITSTVNGRSFAHSCV